MSTSKTQYTPEDTAKLVQLYNKGQGKTVQELSEIFARSVKSIVAKLSREKVYQKAEQSQSKSGTSLKKDELVTSIGDSIADILGVELPENDLDSLTKATKSALLTISNALEAVNIEIDTETEETETEETETEETEEMQANS